MDVLERNHAIVLSLFIYFLILLKPAYHFLIQTLDVLLQILVVFPKVEPLRTKVRVQGRILNIFGFVVSNTLPNANLYGI